MSDWEGRLQAVATLANRPRPMDGELYCANRTCGNRRLNRTDLTCWVCGGDRFIPASEEMRASNRFTFVTPPRKVEPEPEKPKPAVSAQQQNLDAWYKYAAGIYGGSVPIPAPAPTQAPTPTAPSAPPGTIKISDPWAEALKRYQASAQQWGATVRLYDPPKRGWAQRISDFIRQL